jgi:hypothetical protein
LTFFAAGMFEAAAGDGRTETRVVKVASQIIMDQLLHTH